MSSFDEIETLCQQADLDFSASECHGIITGLICTAAASARPWLDKLYTDNSIHHINDTDLAHWNQLYTASLTQLSATELNFQLLLPDDQHLLSQRTAALTDWCCGFLFGISAGDLKLDQKLPADINEIIHDLAQISNAGYDEADNNNEGETAYMELYEYVRGAAMLIFSTLQSSSQTLNADDTRLH